MIEPTSIDSLPTPEADGAGQSVPDPVPPPALPDPMTSEHSLAMYGDYKIDIEYHTNHGLDMLPVGREGEPNVVVQRSSKVGTKVVQWTASRWWVKPTPPLSDTKDPNEVLLDEVFYPANGLQTRNGILYRVSGKYIYGLRVPKVAGRVGVKYPMGVSSAEVASPDERFYGASDFDPKPLDCSALHDAKPSFVLSQVIQSS